MKKPKPPAKPKKDTGERPAQQIKVSAQSWSGPLPPPEILRGFSDVVENGAERILTQWEAETQHRRKMERRDLTWGIVSEIMGKTFAILFCLGALVTSAVLAYLDAKPAAAVVGGTIVGAVIWAFARTRR